jgi:hypothetical protein
MDPIYAQTFSLMPAEKATLVVLAENTLFKVRAAYEQAIEDGDGYGADAARKYRDSLYSAIRALEPDRPCLPENR